MKRENSFTFKLRNFKIFTRGKNGYEEVHSSDYAYTIRYNFETAAKQLLSYALEKGYALNKLEFENNDDIPTRITLYKKPDEYGFIKTEICYADLLTKEFTLEEIRNLFPNKVEVLKNKNIKINLEDGPIIVPGN